MKKKTKIHPLEAYRREAEQGIESYHLSADGKKIERRQLAPAWPLELLRDPNLDGPTGEKYTLRFSKAIKATGPYDPKFIAAVQRAIKTQRQALKRRLARGSSQSDSVERELELLDDLETQVAGVTHRQARKFEHYGGKPPTADQIIQNAIVWRCVAQGKLHLIVPKLAAMFPNNAGYQSLLAAEIQLNAKVRQTVKRIRAKQIVGEYEDRGERLIAEHYFDGRNKLEKPLCKMAPDKAAEALEIAFGYRLSADKYRRHVKALFLTEYR